MSVLQSGMICLDPKNYPIMFLTVFANVIFQSHMEAKKTVYGMLKVHIIEKMVLFDTPVKTFKSCLWALLKRANI